MRVGANRAYQAQATVQVRFVVKSSDGFKCNETVSVTRPWATLTRCRSISGHVSPAADTQPQVSDAKKRGVHRGRKHRQHHTSANGRHLRKQHWKATYTLPPGGTAECVKSPGPA